MPRDRPAFREPVLVEVALLVVPALVGPWGRLRREEDTPMPSRPPGHLGQVQDELARLALTYPESHEDHPWGHVAIKVRGKMFLILGGSSEFLTVTCKLPASRHEALLLPFAEPTGYGMGRHGWVSARFDPGDEPPVSILVDWIDESFRAVAPKTVVRALDGEPAPARRRPGTGKKKKKKKGKGARGKKA